jgi:hypothetical protein
MGSLTPSQLAVVHDYQKIPDLGGLHALAEAAQSSMSINNSSDSSSPPLDVSGSTSSSSSTPTELQWLSWPPDLPSPHILAKLVEVFFNSVPLASRLLHRPTFMLSLSLNPTSSKFPGRHLLHSICAVASVHAAMVLNELPYSGGAEVNTPYAWERHRSGKTESFGEFHARRTKELTEEMEQSGDRIFEGVQGKRRWFQRMSYDLTMVFRSKPQLSCRGIITGWRGEILIYEYHVYLLWLMCMEPTFQMGRRKSILSAECYY